MTRKTGRLVAAGLFVAALVLGLPVGVSAQAACFADLRDCYIRASRMRYWVDRTIAGLDCELDFVECARRKILGR
jgi:hypothetical protein